MAKYTHNLLVLITLLYTSWQVCAQNVLIEPDGQTQASSASPHLARLDKLADQGDALEIYSQEFVFWSYVYGTQNTKTYYIEILERVRQAKDPSSLPALEAILNKGYDQSVVDETIRALRSPASRTWYEIKWSDKELTQREKAQSAMLGLIPEPDVMHDSLVSAELLKSLGKEARIVLYEYLYSNKTEYAPDEWTVEASKALSKVLEDKVFAPSPIEATEVYRRANRFSQIALIQRDLSSKQQARAVDGLINWLKSVKKENIRNSDRYYIHGLMVANQAQNLSLEQRRLIAKQTHEIAKRRWSDWESSKRISSIDASLIYHITQVLISQDIEDVTRDYISNYKRLRADMQERGVSLPQKVTNDRRQWFEYSFTETDQIIEKYQN